MKRITTKVRRFELAKAAEKVLLVVLALSIFDVLVAFLGAPYLSENIGVFLDKPREVIISDLMFLEGGAIFAVGSFIAVARSMRETEPSYETSTETTDSAEQTHAKRIHPSILMIIIGAILLGLSMTVA